MLPPFSCGYTHSCQLLLAEIKGKKQCISIQRNVYTSYFTWSDDCVGCSVSSKADKCPHYPHLAIVKVNCDLFHGQNPESIQRKSPSPSFLFPHFCVCVSSSFTPPLPPPSFSLSLPLYIAHSPMLSPSPSPSAIQVNVAPNTVMASRLKKTQVRQTKQSKPIYTHSQD